MTTGTPEDNSTFGSVDDADLDFGSPALDPDAESSFSTDGFSPDTAAGGDDRVVPGHLFAHEQPQQNHPMTPTPPVPAAPFPAPVSPMPVPPVPPAVTPAVNPAPNAPATAADPDTVTFGPGAPTGPFPPSVTPTPGPARRSRKAVLVAGAAALSLLAATGAFAAYKLGVFGAVGPQPADALPDTAFVYAAVDFNPSAKAKIGAYEFVKQFPAAHVTSADSFKDEVLSSLLNDTHGLLYDTDLKPWVGDRAAIALVPAPGTDDGVTPILALQVTDRDTAETSLDTLKARAQGPRTQEYISGNGVPANLAYAFTDNGYVLISDNQTEVNAAATAETTLADDTTFTHDMDALSDDTVAQTWVDLDGAKAVLPTPGDPTQAASLNKLTGSFAAGLTLTADHADITGHTFGMNPAGKTLPTTTLADTLPGDASAALEVTGLGDTLTTAWKSYSDLGETLTGGMDLNNSAGELGLDLPGDFMTLFGSDFAVAAKFTDTNQPVFVTAKTPDPTTSTNLVRSLVALNGEHGVTVTGTNNGYVATTNKKWAASGGGLADNPAFKKAVPYTNGNAYGYLNLHDLIGTFAVDNPNVAPLDALGFAAKTTDTEGTFTVRVTTR